MNSLVSIIRSAAEDCAYSFKGLYKQSDINEKYSSMLLFVPISASIVFLVFPNITTTIVGKIISIITLIFSIILLSRNGNAERIVEYRRIANQYKSLFDEFHLISAGIEKKPDEIKKLLEKKNTLNDLTSQYPIGIFAKIWTKVTIKSEMAIDWIYAQQSLPPESMP